MRAEKTRENNSRALDSERLIDKDPFQKNAVRHSSRKGAKSMFAIQFLDHECHNKEVLKLTRLERFQ